MLLLMMMELMLWMRALLPAMIPNRSHLLPLQLCVEA
jgi:hypothetical protein